MYRRRASTEGGAADRRRHPRVWLDGEARWRLDGRSGRGRILNLSPGGVEVAFDRQPLPERGAVAHLVLEIQGTTFAEVPARVVHTTSRSVGFEFEKPRE